MHAVNATPELLFEAASSQVRTETVEAVFAGLERRESFSFNTPDDLGRRCESVLAGQLPEWFEENAFLDGDDLHL